MNEVMNYRFSRGGGLQGHSLGNLLIAATTELKGGHFEDGVRALSGRAAGARAHPAVHALGYPVGG